MYRPTKECKDCHISKDLINDFAKGQKRCKACWSLHHRARNYGATLTHCLAKLKEQGGACAICGGHGKSGRYLSVNHDHRTFKARGMLCETCNAMLGMAKDDVSILRAAVEYLKEYGIEDENEEEESSPNSAMELKDFIVRGQQ